MGDPSYLDIIKVATGLTTGKVIVSGILIIIAICCVVLWIIYFYLRCKDKRERNAKYRVV